MSSRAAMNSGRKIVRQGQHTDTPLAIVNFQELHQNLRECRRDLEEIRDGMRDLRDGVRDLRKDIRGDAGGAAENKDRIAAQEAKNEIGSQNKQITATGVPGSPTTYFIKACCILVGIHILVHIL
ncbi:hypothetical protein V500_00412 [Pseudogymnoascus sp. VKM F-4518 (FW-2643)]|nr:hypothetical protein V500_00412 [Pseudogymnoascus sp. VKM F-4518 (FW-2643)]